MQPEQQHLVGFKTLSFVLVGLMLLTVLTVAVSYVNMGVFNVAIALTIASLKVSLVLLYFMHLKFEGRAIRYSFLATICFLAIMITFTFWDVAYRH